MSDIAISVENLSKAYRIGLKEEIPDSLMVAVVGWAKAPLRNLRRLRRLNTFNMADKSNGQAEEDDTLWALRDVSFEVKHGEVVGIIGRNGAGKSTLLKVLSRITEPTSGRAVIRGRVSSLLEVGTGFHPELSGRENVYMNGTILGMTKREIDRKFDEIVDFSGVEKFLDTPVKRYSSGMKVRLAFAVAAHLEPEILIIDEVLAVGDMEFQNKCLGKMENVAKSGRTVLFVSHNMPAVSRLCSRGILLQDGTATFLGGISDVIEHYLSHMGVEHEQDLGSRTDRSGNGRLRFFRASVQTPEGRRPAVGSPVQFCVGLKAQDENGLRSARRIDVGIKICDTTGTVLFTCATHHNGVVIKPDSDQFQLTCSMPKLPLMSGRYSMRLWCGIDADAADSIDRACEFTVESGDFFGTGKMPKSVSQAGTFLVDHEWQVESGS